MNGLFGRLTGVLGRKAEIPPTASAPEPASIPDPALAPIGSEGVSFYRVTTASGLFLSVPAGAASLAATPVLDAVHAVVALVPDAMPHACLLVTPDIGSFAVAGDPHAGIAASGRLLQTDKRRVVRLRYPLGSQGFLSASTQPPITVRFDAPGDVIQATFTLHELAQTELPVSLRSLAAELGGAASEGFGVASLLHRLKTGALRPGLVTALVRLMPQEQLDALARRLLQEPATLARLQRAMPDDTWLADRLPALAAWLADGRPGIDGHTLSSPAAEEAQLLPVTSRGVVPAGLALHALARRHALPRRTVCLLATARNEGPYLLDWVAYHLSIGFEHIFLYTNDNQDGSARLLDSLAAGGAITLVNNERGGALGPQEKAYAHALTSLSQILDYRWTAILDIDEYMAFDTTMFDSVTDFIGFHEAQPADAIALCWAMFAAMPGERWADSPSPMRFVRREGGINNHVKSLFRTRLFWYAQPHNPYATLDAAFHYRTEDGRVHHHPGVQGRLAAFAETASANQAWINHYMLRTADEALWKWSRGRADWLTPQSDERRAWFLDFVSQTFLDLARPERLVEDRRILSCARSQGAMLDRLRSLPGVAEADAAAKTQFADQLTQNTRSFLSAELPADAPVTLRQFRELLADTHA